MNWNDLTWPEIKTLAPDTPVVIPVAAIEQHGHHLPSRQTVCCLAK